MQRELSAKLTEGLYGCNICMHCMFMMAAPPARLVNAVQTSPCTGEALRYTVYSANRLSSSSIRVPNRFSAALTGSGVLMSTPAIFSRLTGSVEQPPERNFR